MFLDNYRVTLRNPIKAKELKVVFNSFLFEGIWALSNIKLVAGCVGFTLPDSNGICNQCS